MLNHKLIPIVIISTLIMALSDCTFFRYVSIGQIQIKDFKRREIKTDCNDNSLILQSSCMLPYNTIQRLESKDLIEIIIKRLNLKNDANLSLSYQEFTNNLQIKYWKRKNIIAIFYKAEDPKLATNIINALMTTYMQQENSKVKMPVAMKSRTSLQATLEECYQEINNLTEFIEKSSSKNNIKEYPSKLLYKQRGCINLQESIEELDKYLYAVKHKTQLENFETRIIKFANHSCCFFK